MFVERLRIKKEEILKNRKQRNFYKSLAAKAKMLRNSVYINTTAANHRRGLSGRNKAKPL